MWHSIKKKIKFDKKFNSTKRKSYT